MTGLVESSKRTVESMKLSSSPNEYTAVLNAIYQLLIESEKLVGSSGGTVVKELKKIKSEYSKALEDFENKKKA